MPQPTTNLATIQLDGDERKQLSELLEWSLKEALVEEHRTDAINYRKFIEQREHIIKNIIAKLRAAQVENNKASR